MDNMSWFNSYRGPKRIIAESGQATCWIGFSVGPDNGRAMRKELYTYGPTLQEALAEAREVYESIPNHLPGYGHTASRSRISRHDSKTARGQ